MSSGHTFPKARRVRRRADFQRVFEDGKRFHGRYLTVLLRPNPAGARRLGVVASRKLGGAVDRNRAKRLIREMFRQELTGEPGEGYDLVVIPRRELLDAGFSSLRQDFRTVWRRAAGRLATSND